MHFWCLKEWKSWTTEKTVSFGSIRLICNMFEWKKHIIYRKKNRATAALVTLDEGLYCFNTGERAVALLTRLPFPHLWVLSVRFLAHAADASLLSSRSSSRSRFLESWFERTHAHLKTEGTMRKSESGLFCQLWHGHDLYNCFWQKCFAYQISFFIKLPWIQ